jgi:O-antigen/teichoic acid export membrane protein
MSAFGVIPLILSSRIYGVHIIGQFALASAPVLALWVLSTAKEQAALIKEITGLAPRHPRVTQLFAAVFTFSSSLTIVMAIVAAIVSWIVFRGPLHQPGLVIPTFVNLAGYALVTNTAWNIDSIFSAFVAGRELFWARTHETLSFLVIVVGVGLAWHSIWGLIIATIGGSLTSLVHRVFLVRRFVRTRLSIDEYREGMRVLPSLLRFGLKITPGGIAQGISLQAGVWALGIWQPVTLVGAYSRAETIPSRLQVVNIRLSEVLYPTLVRRRASGDGEGFDRALIDSIRYALIGLLMVAAVFGGAAHSVLEIFGPGFNRASSALILLILYPALSAVTLAQTQALLAVNRPGLTSIIAIIRMIVTISLTVILTPIVGIVGPAIALMAGFAIQIFLGTIAVLPLLSRHIYSIWSPQEQIALAIAYVAGFGAARLVEHTIPSIAGLLPSLIAGTVFYAAAFLATGGVNHKDRRRLMEIVALARSWRTGRRPRGVRESTLLPVSSIAQDRELTRPGHSLDQPTDEPKGEESVSIKSDFLRNDGTSS